jgi:hypothetical protein
MSKGELKSIYDIREDKVDINSKAWDDPIVQRLVYKQILMWEKSVDWATDWLNRGQKLMNYYRGKILTDAQIATYEDVEDKVVIQPPIAKSPIRGLVGQTIKSRKSGQITTEGGGYGVPCSSTEEITTINMVLKDLEIKTGEKYKVRDVIHDACVTCLPNVLYYEKYSGSSPEELKIKLRKLPWDSVTYGPPTFQETDCSDLREIFFYDCRSQAELEDNFPDRKKQIRDHFDMGKNVDSHMLSSIAQWEDSESSGERDSLWNILDRSFGTMRSGSGLVPVVMHLYPIKKKHEVWMHMFDDEKFEIRPPDWDDKRWDKWVEANKDTYAGPYEKEIVVLWITVYTLSGLVLSNEEHWFQENGLLPVSWWVPGMVAGVPIGPMEDMAEDVLRNCIAQIEWLDDVRKGHGILALIREGALTKKSAECIGEEANKAFGMVTVKQDFQGSLQDAFMEVRREPSNTWQQYGDAARSDMYENTRLNETMQGAAAPRQAAVAKEIEIAQALIVSAIYIDNFNRAWENHQNIKLKLIKYVYDEYDVLEIYDEDEQVNKEQPINVPVYDQDGKKVDVINDLTSHKYKWRMNPVDDSPTAKIRQAEEALMIINGVAGPLLGKDPTCKMFANFLVSFPNELLNKAGKAIAKDAQMSMQSQSDSEKKEVLRQTNLELLKASKTGVNLSITGDQIAAHPKLFDMYMQLQQMAGSQAQAAANPPEQQQQPQPQPQGQ